MILNPNTNIPKELAKELIDTYGSPLYIYDQEIIQERINNLKSAFQSWPTQIFYAMKANNNLSILKMMQKQGLGFDCVSTFELRLGLLANTDPKKLFFTVSNMNDREMHSAMKKSTIINIDSISRLKIYAQQYPNTKISIRLTPEVVAGHHKAVQTGYEGTKFGMLLKEIKQVLAITKENNIKVIGLHQHTGSGISDLSKALLSIKKLLSVAPLFPDIEFLNFGGGFNIPYVEGEDHANINVFAQKTIELVNNFCKEQNKNLTIAVEPGRYLVAESGTLLCTVTTLKTRSHKTILGVDTGFNHLLRPVMYDSYHKIQNTSNHNKQSQQAYDITGNICESGDIFAKSRNLPETKVGDILAIRDAGAYGFSMASNYNARALPAEVMIYKNQESKIKHKLIRKRQKFNDVIAQMLIEE